MQVEKKKNLQSNTIRPSSAHRQGEMKTTHRVTPSSTEMLFTYSRHTHSSVFSGFCDSTSGCSEP